MQKTQKTGILKCSLATPCGNLWISGNGFEISNISWDCPPKGTDFHNGELDWFAYALKGYLQGKVKKFPGSIEFKNGMPVWSRKTLKTVSEDNLLYRVFGAMSEIPFGTVRTYGEIGEEAGNKRYARAVGRICSINPLVIVIPCHRVVAASHIGGYSAGLEKKRYLLGMEGINY